MPAWRSGRLSFARVESERQLAAFYRLLGDAALGGHARVDALVALAQRTVWVVPWPDPSAGWRTLVNADGKAALPIFTDQRQLEVAAARFGWLGPDRKVLSAEVGSREAFRYARDKALAFVVVDIAAEHTVEVSREELEPLLTPAARRQTGPFAGTGRVSSTLMAAARSQTPAPMSAATGSAPSRSLAVRMTPAPGSLRAVSAIQPPGPARAVAPPPGTGSSPGIVRPPGVALPVLPSVRLAPLVAPVDDALLDSLEAILRDHPEVEWACLGIVNGDVVVGIRIDARLRSRLESLAQALAATPVAALVTLDDATHLKAARAEALMFFPWRRR